MFGQLFSGITLRESLGRLSGATEVPIWLDRRVDGEQQVNLIAGDATVRQTLDALTEQLNLGWVWIGEVPYVCLAADAPHLQASFWRHAIASKGLLRSRPPIDLRWSQPAEPRILLNEFLSGADLDVEVLDTPEHDLWAPAALQGTRPETAATLLLGGFELELAARGSGLAIEAIGEVDAVAEDGRLSFAWPYPAAAVDKIDASRRKAIETRHAGHFEWRVVGDRAWLKASAEMHRELQSAISKLSDAGRGGPLRSSVDSASPRPPATAAQIRRLERQRYDLRLHGRLIDVLPKIAAQTGLQIDGPIELAVGDRVVDVSVSNATIDELMQAIASSAGCSIVREGLLLRMTCVDVAD